RKGMLPSTLTASYSNRLQRTNVRQPFRRVIMSITRHPSYTLGTSSPRPRVCKWDVGVYWYSQDLVPDWQIPGDPFPWSLTFECLYACLLFTGTGCAVLTTTRPLLSRSSRNLRPHFNVNRTIS